MCEGRQVFKDLTVTENLKMGAYTRKGRRDIEAALQRVYAYYPCCESAAISWRDPERW